LPNPGHHGPRIAADEDASALLEQGHHVGAVLPQPVLDEANVAIRRRRQRAPHLDDPRTIPPFPLIPVQQIDTRMIAAEEQQGLAYRPQVGGRSCVDHGELRVNSA
jgi:hypothetical protein